MKEEYKTHGRYASGCITKEQSGARFAIVNWANHTQTKIESIQVDLDKCKVKSLEQAIYKACHENSMLHIFQKKVIKGPKALINIFYRPNDEEKGYATISKKGQSTIRFSLQRLDLSKMKEKTPLAALQKVAFRSGKISLK
jgi:hypothetical protein